MGMEQSEEDKEAYKVYIGPETGGEPYYFYDGDYIDSLEKDALKDLTLTDADISDLKAPPKEMSL